MTDFGKLQALRHQIGRGLGKESRATLGPFSAACKFEKGFGVFVHYLRSSCASGTLLNNDGRVIPSLETCLALLVRRILKIKKSASLTSFWAFVLRHHSDLCLSFQPRNA